MNYFLEALRKYADFSGRSRRSEYWYFALFNFITLIVAVMLDNIWGYPILTGIAFLGLIVPSISVLVRRLHDTSRSGWYYFISLIPLVGSILLLVWLASDGTPGPNKWGNNPKEIGAGDDLVDHLVE